MQSSGSALRLVAECSLRWVALTELCKRDTRRRATPACECVCVRDALMDISCNTIIHFNHTRDTHTNAKNRLRSPSMLVISHSRGFFFNDIVYLPRNAFVCECAPYRYTAPPPKRAGIDIVTLQYVRCSKCDDCAAAELTLRRL